VDTFFIEDACRAYTSLAISATFFSKPAYHYVGIPRFQTPDRFTVNETTRDVGGRFFEGKLDKQAETLFANNVMLSLACRAAAFDRRQSGASWFLETLTKR
jgi:hypothetical protein